MWNPYTTGMLFLLASNRSAYRRGILLSTLVVEGGIALVAVFLAYVLDFDIRQHFTWSWADFGWGCVAAVPPLLAVWMMNLFPIGPLRRVREITDQVLRPLLRPCRWPDFVIMSALAGFCEELLFRGWLQPYLDLYLPSWATILVVGAVFGLMHPITVAYVVIAFGISIYLSWLLVWSDNLLVPMVTHGVYDLIALIAMMWSEYGERDGRLGGESPVPFDQGGSEVGRGEQAEESPQGIPAGEAGGENGETHSAWRAGTPGEESTGPEGVS